MVSEKHKKIMRKILNPFREYSGYNCFACCPDNKSGLQMTFYEDGEYIYSKWKPRQIFQGYMNVLHGGIQSTLIDEIASWTCYIKAGTAGVTARIEVRYKLPVYVDKGIIKLKSKIDSIKRNIARIKAELYDSQNQLCAEGTVDYYLIPEGKARKELYYPGVEKFFEK